MPAVFSAARRTPKLPTQILPTVQELKHTLHLRLHALPSRPKFLNLPLTLIINQNIILPPIPIQLLRRRRHRTRHPRHARLNLLLPRLRPRSRRRPIVRILGSVGERMSLPLCLPRRRSLRPTVHRPRRRIMSRDFGQSLLGLAQFSLEFLQLGLAGGDVGFPGMQSVCLID